MDDETFAARLRGAVRAQDLTSDLNPYQVLGRARRSRRRVVIARSAGTLVVALGVLVGGSQMLGSPGLLQGLHTAGQQDAARDPSVVEVAPGVVATLEPGVRVLADGTGALVLGLTASNLSNDASEIAVVPNDGANAASFSDAPWRDNAFEIALLAGDVVAQRQYWDGWVSHAPLTEREREYWTLGGASAPEPLDPQLMAGRPPALAPDEGWAMAWPFDDGTWLIVGYLPSGTEPDLLARVSLREAIPGPEDDSLPVLDLPTFDAGSLDGRRMFTATIAPDIGVPTPTDDVTAFVLERVPVVAVPQTA